MGAQVRKNTVRLSQDVAHRVRSGHPWVYREALGPRPLSPEPGTPIDLVDPDGEFVGRGLYDADSIIALRVFVRNPDVQIDGALIAERVRAAVAMRNPMFSAVMLSGASGKEPVRDMVYGFTTRGQFRTLTVTLGGSSIAVNPQSMRYVDALGQMAVVDGASQGLVLIDLQAVTVARAPYF